MDATAPRNSHRLEELRDRLNAVDAKVAAAAHAVGRNRDDITIIAVTKTHPSDDIRSLHRLGVRDVGESRDQEAIAKHDDLADLGLTWHFIGQIQTNKAAHIASYADVVHGVDRPRIAEALGRAAVKKGRELTVLIQVSLDGDGTEGRAGVEPTGLLELAGLVSRTPGLHLGGLMAVAPLQGSATVAFARLSRIRSSFLEQYPAATMLSAGMSGDFVEAIAIGATHLRIGSAILGNRPSWVVSSVRVLPRAQKP